MDEPSTLKAAGADSRELWQPQSGLPDVYQDFAAPSSSMIDVSSIRGLLNRQLYPMLAAIVAALIIGGIVTALQTRLYTASATVRLQPNGSEQLDPLGVTSSMRAGELNTFVRTLGEVAKSRSMAETVARDLKLGDRSEFIGADIDERRPANQSDDEWAEAKVRKAASKLVAGLKVDVPLADSILTLTFTDKSPVLAAEIANGYAKAFAAADTREDIEESEYAKEYLTAQIADTREQLRAAEMAANDYARGAALVAAGAIDVGTGTAVTVTGTNLATINNTVSQARAARINAEQRWRSVQSIRASELPEVLGNATVQSLTTERVKLQNELVGLSERYTEQFPEIINVRRRIEQIDSQIAEIGQTIKAGIRNDFVVALNQERALQGELDQVTSTALNEQDRQVQLGVLERDTQSLRAKLDSLLKAFNDLAATANVDRGTVSMLDSALVPTSPSSPNIFRNILLSLFAGIGLAGALAFIREFMDDRVRSSENVQSRLGIPVLGETPKIDANELSDNSANQFSRLVEAYASIKTTIEFSIPRDHNVIQVTSSQAGEGKSTTSLMLAQLFARTGRRTLLVDADLRRPSIGALIDVEPGEMGLAEVLLGHSTLADALTQNMHDNLDILTVGRIPAGPVELLSSRAFEEFIRAQRREYSMVIFDSPPVLGLADAPLISRHVDATVFVIESSKVRFGQSRGSLNRLRSSGAKVIGAVLTKYVPERAGQSYGYGQDYYSYGKESSSAQ